MAIEMKKICRACLAESITLTPIWSSDKCPSNSTHLMFESPSLAQMLNTLTSYDVKENDDLPEKMCLNCINELNQAFAFIQKCERSEKFLLSYLKRNKSTKTPKIFQTITIPPNETTTLETMAIKPQYIHKPKPNAMESKRTSGTRAENSQCKSISNEKWSIQKRIDDRAKINKRTGPTATAVVSRPNVNSRFAEIRVTDFVAENALKFVCSYCKTCFTSRQSFSMHINCGTCAPGRGHVSYECDICHKKFVKKSNLSRHLKQMHQTINEDNIGKKKVDNKREYKCHLCQKAFTMASSLKEHFRIHTGVRPFLCAVCGKSFTQNSNLRQHLMRHNQIKSFECLKCKANFVSKGELASHSRTHSGDRPFNCEACNSRFTTSSSLVKHRRIHSGEKPYRCDLCPMQFTASGTMKNHRRIHTGEKPYKCEVCSKSFTQRTDCVSHLRIHSEDLRYRCENCEASFLQLKSLKLHTKKCHLAQKSNSSST